MNLVKWIDQRRHWWKVFVLIFSVSIAVVGYIGWKTYEYAPPVADFVGEDGRVVFPADDIPRGQKVFFRYGLMEYGSFLGDGGMRGPDFTAEALHLMAVWMIADYDAQWVGRIPDPAVRRPVVQALVQQELRRNRHDPAYYTRNGGREMSTRDPGAVVMSPAQVRAFENLARYYGQKFGSGGDLAGKETFKPANYIDDPARIREFAAFCWWGGWLCSAQRPGHEYSYTHNWPYDPLAGNTPHGGLVLWSVIGILVVIFGIGLIFYYYGKLDRDAIVEQQAAQLPPFATGETVDRFKPTPTQRATYGLFTLAAVLFLIQVTAGLLAISDFVDLFRWIGVDVRAALPVTVTRAWHSQISVLWIAICWFAATIWVLPLICRPEPQNDSAAGAGSELGS